MDERGAGEGSRTVRRPPGGVVQLASREDFRLGQAVIQPALRTVEGPGGSSVIEPRVMQVLVAFADSGGAVLTRDDLMRSCWGGAIVSEDAVNRTVAEIRRIARQTGAGLGISTIPRVGYRLEVSEGVPVAQPLQASQAPRVPAPDPAPQAPAETARDTAKQSQAHGQDYPQPVSRRLVAGALAASAVVGAAAALRWKQPARDPVFEGFLNQGLQDLMMEYGRRGTYGVEPFSEAVKLRPDDARAWGLLALAHAYEAELNVPGSVQGCETAAAEALRLKPNEPNALVALALLRREQESWVQTERQLRAVIDRHPFHRWGLTALMMLLQSSGYSRESHEVNRRILDVDRREFVSTPGALAREALKLWINGAHDEAQRMAEYAWKAHHDHPLVSKAMVVVYTFTGRYTAARQLLESAAGERDMTPDGVRLYLMALDTLENPTRENRARLSEAFLDTHRQRYLLMMHGVLLLSHMDEVDAAYEIYDGIVMSRGSQVVLPVAQDPQWRKTMWLFTPAMRPLRADLRFRERTRALGLDAYWDERGIEPDEGRMYRSPERSSSLDPQSPARI